MLVLATKSFTDACSPMAIVAGELVEAEDELALTWIAIGSARAVTMVDGNLSPAPVGDIEIKLTPGLRRRQGAARK
jgi:hypothetical protein